MGKKRRLPLHYALQPMPRWMAMPPQSLVFPGCPSNKNIVQALKVLMIGAIEPNRYRRNEATS
jgi:hypothetical protein